MDQRVESQSSLDPQQQLRPQPSQPQPGPHPQPQPLRYQVHHSYIWFESVRMAGVLLVVLIVAGLSTFGSLVGSDVQMSSSVMLTIMPVLGGIVLVLLFVLLVFVVFRILEYRYLWYELDPEEFNLYSGILNKKRVHVPYQRIQSVNQHATLLQRIFGVCSVHLDTAGGAANKAVVVPYMQKERAEELRRELFARKQHQMSSQSDASQITPTNAVSANQASGNVLDAPAEIWQDVRGVFGGQAVYTGQVSFEYGLFNRELIFTGLSNNTAFVAVVLGIIAVLVQVVSTMAPFILGSVRRGLLSFDGNFVFVGAIILFVVAVVVWLLSAVGTCISYGGFRARRRDNRIEVERGLLQHHVVGVDIDRVQSVVVRQSFFRRLLGYCEVSVGKVDAIIGDDEQDGNNAGLGMVIHPFVKLNRVPEILAGIIPEFAGVPQRSTPVPKVALRRAILRRGFVQGTGFWLAVLVALVQYALNSTIDVSYANNLETLSTINTIALVAYVFCFVLFVLDVVGALLWYRGAGFAYNRLFMQVTNGGFSRETVSFPRRKIQFGYTKTNPLQRLARTATICARTAAGVGGTSIRLIDANSEDANAWLTWLEPRVSPETADE